MLWNELFLDLSICPVQLSGSLLQSYHQKSPSWKSVNTEQNQPTCTSCITNVLGSRTAMICGFYSFTSPNVTHFLSTLSLVAVTGMNPGSHQVLGQRCPVSSWKTLPQSHPSGPTECLQKAMSLNFNSGHQKAWIQQKHKFGTYFCYYSSC